MMITGYELLFPFVGGMTVGNMELAEVVHGVIGVLFIALILAHMYLGTIGMEGAFESMSNGTVDVNWAKEHHDLWYAEQTEDGAATGAHAQPAE